MKNPLRNASEGVFCLPESPCACVSAAEILHRHIADTGGVIFVVFRDEFVVSEVDPHKGDFTVTVEGEENEITGGK